MFYHLYDGKVCIYHGKMYLATEICQITNAVNFRVEENLKMNCMNVLAILLRCHSWSQIGRRLFYCILFYLYCFTLLGFFFWIQRWAMLCSYRKYGDVHYTYFPRKMTAFNIVCKKNKIMMMWLILFSSDFRAPLPGAVKTILDEGVSLFRMHQSRHGRYETDSHININYNPFFQHIVNNKQHFGCVVQNAFVQ